MKFAQDVNGSTLSCLVWISPNVHRTEQLQLYIAVFYKIWVISSEILSECSPEMSKVVFLANETFHRAAKPVGTEEAGTK